MSTDAESFAAVDDDTAGFVSVGEGSDRLAVVFGGLVGAGFLGIPPFEFANLLAGLPADKLFLRDLDQAWYHQGVRGLADSLPSLIEALRPRVEAYERSVFIGHSSGGFAALIAGCVLGVDEVVATSPQTSITRRYRRLSREWRWATEIERTYRVPTVTRSMLDTKRWVRHNRGRTHVQVFYGVGNKWDAAHANRLRKLTNVHVQPQPYKGHSVAKFMRDQGTLLPILHAAVEGR